MSNNNKFVDDDRFDGLYLNVAQTAHGIEPLLDTVFSFLRRKTDFFKGPPGSTNGTQDAIAKVHQVLEKHAQVYQMEQEKNKPKPKKPVPKKPKQQKEEEVIEMGTDGGFDVSSTTKSTPPAPVKESKPAATTTASSLPAPAKPPPAAAAAEVTTKPDEQAKPDDNNNKEKDDGTPPVGNGGTVPGKYVWTQILSEVAVTVPLPDNTRGRDLNVTITKKHLKVGLKQSPSGIQWLVDDDLTKPIIMDDSFWTVEDGNRLVINLQKSNDMEWWDSVCAGDNPKINIQKIQPENSSLNDLDGETRKTVEKMMYDNRQKALGLPTSEEEKKFEMLEKFKAQHPELDFSNAKIS